MHTPSLSKSLSKKIALTLFMFTSSATHTMRITPPDLSLELGMGIAGVALIGTAYSLLLDNAKERNLLDQASLQGSSLLKKFESKSDQVFSLATKMSDPACIEHATLEFIHRNNQLLTIKNDPQASRQEFKQKHKQVLQAQRIVQQKYFDLVDAEKKHQSNHNLLTEKADNEQPIPASPKVTYEQLLIQIKTPGSMEQAVMKYGCTLLEYQEQAQAYAQKKELIKETLLVGTTLAVVYKFSTFMGYSLR